MADEKYVIPEEPDYTAEDIRKLQDSDPASASQTFNLVIQRVLESVGYLKKNKVESRTGTIPPTSETPASPGWHYYDTEGKKEYVCQGQDEEGNYIWKLAGATDASDLTYNGIPLDNALDGLASVDAQAAAQATAMDSRIALLELMVSTNVSGNPFSVTFEDLDGLAVAGIWNTAQNRVDF